MPSCYKKCKDHLENYTCLLTFDDSVFNQQIPGISSTFIQVHNAILNAVILYGNPLNHWIISKAIMIQKELNNPKINEICGINKLEANYKLVLKFH